MFLWWVYLQHVLSSVATKIMLRTPIHVQRALPTDNSSAYSAWPKGTPAKEWSERSSSSSRCRRDCDSQRGRLFVLWTIQLKNTDWKHPIKQPLCLTPTVDSTFFGNARMNWSKGGNWYSLRGHSGYVCHYTYTSVVHLTAAADTSNIQPT